MSKNWVDRVALASGIVSMDRGSFLAGKTSTIPLLPDYLNVDVDAGLTPETTETIRFQISRYTLAAMFPGKNLLNLNLQDNWLMTLVCRELGFDDSHVWEVYARAAEEKIHPMRILWNEYDLIKKLEGDKP